MNFSGKKACIEAHIKFGNGRIRMRVYICASVRSSLWMCVYVHTCVLYSFRNPLSLSFPSYQLHSALLIAWSLFFHLLMFFQTLLSSVLSSSSKSAFTRALDRHFSSDKFPFGLSWPFFFGNCFYLCLLSLTFFKGCCVPSKKGTQHPFFFQGTPRNTFTLFLCHLAILVKQNFNISLSVPAQSALPELCHFLGCTSILPFFVLLPTSAAIQLLCVKGRRPLAAGRWCEKPLIVAGVGDPAPQAFSSSFIIMVWWPAYKTNQNFRR